VAPEKKRLLLRIRPDLWEDLSRWASDELRSINGQIEYLLREAVRRRKGEAEASRSGKPSGSFGPEDP